MQRCGAKYLLKSYFKLRVLSSDSSREWIIPKTQWVGPRPWWTRQSPLVWRYGILGRNSWAVSWANQI